MSAPARSRAATIAVWITAIVVFCAALVLSVSAVAAQQPPAPAAPVSVPVTTPRVAGPPALVRCLPDRAMPCFQITLNRPTGAASRSADTATAAWAASVGATRLIGPGIIRMGFDSSRTVRLLVVTDVSGSMKGEGIAFTRSALRSFITALPPSGMEVALVPFDSRRVAARFAEGRFVPPSGALAQLDALPPVSGNTALYSAIAEGLRMLDRPGGVAGATVLLVITDGMNDVGKPGDDPGLLSGDTGRDEARRLIAASKHQVWLVGAGAGVNSAELATLAGDRATSRVVAMDPGALLALLESIRLSLATQYTLVYGLPGTVAARLGRRPVQVTVRGDSALLPRWRPPLLARAPFTGVADSALLSRELRAIAEGGEVGNSDRLLIGGALFVVLLSAYAVLWRLAGETVTVGAAGVTPTATPKPVPSPAQGRGSDASIRRDVLDAPPRSPNDITHDEAA